MPEAPIPFPSKATSTHALPAPFVCRLKPDGFGSVSVHLDGELDLSTLPQFKRTLREAQLGANVVSIDLQELSFIDCSALKVILDANAVAQRAGNRLVLVLGSGQVNRLLRLTGILEQIETVDLHPAEVAKETTSRRARVGLAA